MKLLSGLLLTIVVLLGDDLKIGNQLEFTYEDQFEKPYRLTNDIRKLIFVFTKQNGHDLKDFLSKQDPKFLESKKALYMADISAMPSIIYSLFAKGDMEDLPYRVVMIHDEEISKKYKTEKNKEKFVVVTLENKKIVKIVELLNVNETIKELDK